MFCISWRETPSSEQLFKIVYSEIEKNSFESSLRKNGKYSILIFEKI